MRRLTPLFGLLLLAMPAFALAEDETRGKLNTDIWYLDTEVMLNGQDLQGSYPVLSKLCFAPEARKEDLRCFTSDHSNITKWSSTNITFVPPKNTPPLGIVVLMHPYYEEDCKTIFRELSCDVELVAKKIEIATYKAHPFISSITDLETGQEALALYPDRSYEVKGYRFGDTGKGIYLDWNMLDQTDILRWTHDSVIFRPTKLPDEIATIRIHNGAGLGNSWELTEQPSNNANMVKTRTRGTIDITKDTGTLPLQASVGGPVVSDRFYTDVDSPFTDIDAAHPYFDAIAWALNHNLVKGYDDGTFQPDREVNRAEFLKIVIEADSLEDPKYAEQQDSFPDVSEDAWFAPYVWYAQSTGIVEGYDDGLFHPEQTVNFAEGLKMAYRLLEIPTLDAGDNEEWYARYLNHAIKNDVLYTHDVHVDTGMTRKDVMWIVWNLKLLKEFNGGLTN